MEPSSSSASSSAPDSSVASQPGKLFVGGLAWGTKDDDLVDYFSKYGDVVSAKVVKDSITGNSRGFAFVHLADSAVAERLIEDKPHVILDTKVDVKRAIPRQEMSDNGHTNRTNRNKIFVGGLPDNLTKEELERYFEIFGEITDAVVVYDHTAKRSRGFGFVTFKLEESVDSVTKSGFYMLKSKKVEVKRAQPKDSINSSGNGHMIDQGFDVRNSNACPINYQGEIYPMTYNMYGVSHLPLYSWVPVSYDTSSLCTQIPSQRFSNNEYQAAEIHPRPVYFFDGQYNFYSRHSPIAENKI